MSWDSFLHIWNVHAQNLISISFQWVPHISPFATGPTMGGIVPSIIIDIPFFNTNPPSQFLTPNIYPFCRYTYGRVDVWTGGSICPFANAIDNHTSATLAGQKKGARIPFVHHSIACLFCFTIYSLQLYSSPIYSPNGLVDSSHWSYRIQWFGVPPYNHHRFLNSLSVLHNSEKQRRKSAGSA